MNRDDYEIAVAALNGRPQRLVTISHRDGSGFRDHINTDSSISRQRFARGAASKFGAEQADLQWLDDAIIEAADTADADADAAVATGERDDHKSQATQLVELAACAELFRDQDNEAYARFAVDEHVEVAGLRTKQFRRWLARIFYLSVGKAPSSQSMQDAIGVLEGKAIFEGPMRSVQVRVAAHDGRIYIDLCNDSWQVVEISATGWQVLNESPVMFRRAKAMLPLPVPARGGAVDELRQFVHLADSEWTLFVAWLVAALRPTGPYPVLDLQGEHGSGKSTACRMARALADPNTAMLRSEPREPRDLMIASKNGWLLALDNLSGLPVWLSDGLCRMATGGGFATRMLFENDEEVIFDAQRPVLINGIDDVAVRADLLDRCLLLNVPRIEQHQRRPEAELWARFEEARPRIFGALLTAVRTALRTIGQTKLPNLPRMADFALWATAAEPALDLQPGAFMAAYQANRSTGNEVALEGCPVGKAVIDFVSEVGQWSGTATDLLQELETRVDDKIRWLKSWPKNARALSSAVTRLAPNFREAGIGVELSRKGKRGSRTIVFVGQPEQACNVASVASASSAMHESSGISDVEADANADAIHSADANAFYSSSAASVVFPEENDMADANDGADANIRARSKSCGRDQALEVNESMSAYDEESVPF